MARPPKHPSGTGRPVNVYLAPEILKVLDWMAVAEGVNRSEMVTLLVLRAGDRSLPERRMG